MDETALRDVESWRDRIEVRLDNRQVFFLFFGSAIVACMLFVLGVIVGKRLESRGRALAPMVEDPLAALDRFGAERGGAVAAPSALTFPRALLGGGSPAAPSTRVSNISKPDRKVDDKHVEDKRAEDKRAEDKRTQDRAEHVERAPSRAPAPSRAAIAEPAVSPPAVAQAVPEEDVTANHKLAALPRPLGAPGSAVSRSTTSALHEAAPAKPIAPIVAKAPAVAASPRVPAAASTPKGVVPVTPGSSKPVLVATTQGAKPVTLTSAKPASPALARSGAPPLTPKTAGAPLAPAPVNGAANANPTRTVAAAPAPSAKTAAAGAAAVASTRKGFLLQLSSFQDRSEADAFARRFASENAYVVPTDVPGKGTVYRVRVGSYASLKEAAAAKTSFEQAHNVIAYVAGSGPAQ